MEQLEELWTNEKAKIVEEVAALVVLVVVDVE